ncbi:MAG: hypothetical protein KGJ73_03895 [Rhodospirillales bacterium]|nr:hypothetical protein [Rhodospirillales bacterium]
MTPDDRELAEKLSHIVVKWQKGNGAIAWPESVSEIISCVTAELAAKAVLEETDIMDSVHGVMQEIEAEHRITPLDAQKIYLESFRPILATLTSQAEALRAENERFREALAKLADASDELEVGKSHTYKARNGRTMSIQGDDGERIDLVHSDLTHTLRLAALKARAALAQSGGE